MLILTLVLFGVAAVLGLTVAAALFKKAPTSKGAALAHGLFAAGGLVLLVVILLRQPHPLLGWAVGLLVVAALGGAVLFANDVRRKPGPLGLVVVHAGVAVVAVVLVLLVALR